MTDVWNTEPVEDSIDSNTVDLEVQTVDQSPVQEKLSKPAKKTPDNSEPLYDLEGLMTDFPTAKELEKFVFDKTGLVLELKGRSNKFKYQTAMDVLNGSAPDDSLLGNENPYLDKNEIGRAHV